MGTLHTSSESKGSAVGLGTSCQHHGATRSTFGRLRRLKIPVVATVGMVMASLLLTMLPANAATTATDDYIVGDGQSTFSKNRVDLSWTGHYNTSGVWVCTYNETTYAGIDGNGTSTGDIRKAIDGLSMAWLNYYLDLDQADLDRDSGGQVSFRGKLKMNTASKITCPNPLYKIRYFGGSNAQRYVSAMTAGGEAGLAAAIALMIATRMAGYQAYIPYTAYQAAVGCVAGAVGHQVNNDFNLKTLNGWYSLLSGCAQGGLAYGSLTKVCRVTTTDAPRNEINDSVASALEWAWNSRTDAYAWAKTFVQGLYAACKTWIDAHPGRVAASDYAAPHVGVAWRGREE